MARVYGNRWEIIASLAQGGQGEVFRVKDRWGEYEGDLALKRVLNPKRHDRFRGEVEAIKRLSHPNIVRLIDHSALSNGGVEPEKQFLVMPLAIGGDLSRRVDLYKGNVDSVVQVVKQIASALKAAHDAGIVHRDIKPQNVLFPAICHDVWLADFGICLIRDQDRATDTSEVVGPAQFIAPELEGGGRLEVTPAADVYSLGKLIYFMFSGGVVLPRERLHEAEYNSVFLQAGERQRLFQVLLAKMLCPLNSRLQTINDVLDEVSRIENWTRDARLLPISQTALAGLETLQRRAIDAQRIAAENEAARNRRSVAIQVTQSGVLDWLKAELEKTATLVGQGAGLSSGVRVVAGEDGVPSINHYVPRNGVELWVQNQHDHFRRQHVLRFSLCSKFSVSVRVLAPGSPPPLEPGEPEHADIGVLPAYGQIPQPASGSNQKANWFLLTSQNGLYQPPENGRPVAQMHQRGPVHPMHVAQPTQVQMITFSTASWPSASELFPDAFKRALDTFVATIAKHM